MRKRHETFVCRKTENTELMRCICGLCEAEALRTDNTECRIANTALQSSVAQLRARVKDLSDCLNTIVAEYNSPPYTELDWISWKQRAEKALDDKR